MNCPFDGTELKVVNRQGVDIDWCASCKGVWLERGELEKLIERSDADDDDRWERERDRRSAPLPPPGYAQPAPRYDDDDDHRYGYGKPYKKKKSFLRDMLDFD